MDDEIEMISLLADGLIIIQKQFTAREIKKMDKNDI